MLVEFLRNAATVASDPDQPSFQVILNTHSPRVMAALRDREIVAADTVTTIDASTRVRSTRTRMRTGVQPSSDLFDPETHLSRYEVERLLQVPTDAA
jgi:hypothetical protein